MSKKTIFMAICHAEHAVNCYSEEMAGGLWGDLYDLDDRVFTYLLADLMHWADAKAVEFNRCIADARTHYLAEKRGAKDAAQ